MFKKIVPAFVAGAMLVGTPIMASAEYEYGYDKSNELMVISQNHQAYMYFTYDNNGNLTDIEYCQSPTNLSATNNAYNTVTLTWSAVPGAKSYRVYENGTELTSSYTGTTAAISNVTSNGSPVTFSVAAVFGDGVSESAQSGTVSLLPATTFTGTNTTTARTATLTWNPVAGATGYYVYADGVQMQSTTGTTVTLTSLTPNHSYKFAVAAYNSQSAGIYANETIATLALPVLSTSNLSTSGVTLSWGAITNATSYNVYLNGTQVANGITTTSYTYAGTLDSTVTNSFTVSAVYSTGEGEQSNPATILPATTITSGSTTVSSATLNWNAVSGATNYSVKLVPTSGTTVTQTVTGTTVTISGLVANTTYTATVTPLSGSIQGFASAPYSLATPYANTPYNVSVGFEMTVAAGIRPLIASKISPDLPTSGGSYNGTTDVSWSAPSNANSTTTYTVYQTDTNGNILSTLASGLTSTSTKLSIGGGTNMSIAVGSTTNGVASGNSSVCSFTTPTSGGGIQP